MVRLPFSVMNERRHKPGAPATGQTSPERQRRDCLSRRWRSGLVSPAIMHTNRPLYRLVLVVADKRQQTTKEERRKSQPAFLVVLPRMSSWLKMKLMRRTSAGGAETQPVQGVELFIGQR